MLKNKSYKITAWGETKSLSAWAEDSRCCVSRNSLAKRLKAGWLPEQAIGRPRTDREKGKRSKQAKVPPDCPLSIRPNGQYSVMRGGTRYYFGSVNEVTLEQAMRKYVKTMDMINAGVDPKALKNRLKGIPEPGGGEMSLRQLVVVWLQDGQRRVEDGEITSITFSRHAKMGKMILDTLGGQFPPNNYRRSEWLALDRAIKKNYRTPESRKGVIQVLRFFANWCYRTEYVDRPIRMGNVIKGPSQRELLLAKKDKYVDPATVRQLLEHFQGTDVGAMISLAINGAFGAKDLSQLVVGDLGWAKTKEGRSYQTIEIRRSKTGIARTCVLWDWTIEQLVTSSCLPVNYEDCPNPYMPFFQRRDGGPLDPSFISSKVSDAVREFDKELGIQLGWFRHSFCSIYDDCRDPNVSHDGRALAHVMGHKRQGMSERYKHRLRIERIAAVCHIVRRAIFPDPPEEWVDSPNP